MSKFYYVHAYGWCLTRLEQLKLCYELFALGAKYWKSSNGEFLIVKSDIPLEKFISYDYFCVINDRDFMHDILSSSFMRVRGEKKFG